MQAKWAKERHGLEIQLNLMELELGKLFEQKEQLAASLSVLHTERAANTPSTEKPQDEANTEKKAQLEVCACGP